MKIYENGVLRDMTAAEEAAYAMLGEIPHIDATPEERITHLENCMKEMDTKVIDTVEVFQILHGEVTE